MVLDGAIRIIELGIDGVARGFVFALLGLGITLVFGLGGILNLAIGAFSVIAVLAVLGILGIVPNLGISILIGITFIGILGVVIDRSLLSLVYRSEGEERILLGIFVTIGLAILIDGLLFIYYSSSYSLSAGIPSISPFGIFIRGSSIAVIGISLVMFLALYFFFSRTYVGQATRTVMQDETGAILCGIDPRKIRTLVFVLSAMIAGMAGILYSFNFEISAASAFNLTIYAIIVSIVGGVTSIVGAVVAGLLLGLIVTFTNAFIGAYIAQVVLFAVAIVALIAKPEQIA